MYEFLNDFLKFLVCFLCFWWYSEIVKLICVKEKFVIRWFVVFDIVYYIWELIDICFWNLVGYDGIIYDMNVLEELDCFVI